MKILLCNISWMKEYCGTLNDKPRHGGKYVDENGFGHEAINFQPHDGFVYGYVQLRSRTINISRLDNEAGDNAEDVLVVWRARSSSGSVIVGWYKHATVFRKVQPPIEGRSFSHNGQVIKPEWIIRAKANDAFVIPADQRFFDVPVTQKGFGSQTFVSFLDSDEPKVAEFKSRLIPYIEQVEKRIFAAPHRGKRGSMDQVRKLKIEMAAIHAVADYYTNRGYDVVSVEKDNLGYDLIVKKQNETLHVEVKGTSGTQENIVTVNLSPNEYQKSQSHKRRYRICIATNCPDDPAVYEFIWSQPTQTWESEITGTSLELKEITSANLTIV
jgi:Protein NO VEIN, C-terminal